MNEPRTGASCAQLVVGAGACVAAGGRAATAASTFSAAGTSVFVSTTSGTVVVQPVMISNAPNGTCNGLTFLLAKRPSFFFKRLRRTFRKRLHTKPDAL